ncbi:helix-turn-helix domain-containing protein [Roseburia sp. 499]|uniref:helix-turn-helix domain-containing protein n=1 Tax=Roseburia sp. 499 TaxID=1261634 RepID=UPI0009519FEA|nr:helix-turn-helix transcriptional regulator [Roseburia sp. 499]WVK68469.1 helix-turn-helix transcriptional regulator [Roseburia sp. 499]
MSNYAIGEILKEIRERKKCSQEEVCYGICAVSTLSRIENGRQIPSKRVLEAVTQRLGIADYLCPTYAGKEELIIYETGKKLAISLENADEKRTKQLIRRLEQQVESLKKVNVNVCMEEQHILYAKAVLQKRKGAREQSILKMMLEAVRLTLPDFDGIHMKNHFLTFQEITILNDIGCLYYELGKKIEAFQILIGLKKYMEEHIPDEKGADKYPAIIQNMVSWLLRERSYEDALPLCEKGLECCIAHGKMRGFPMLLYQKATLLAETGQVDKSRECFFQSIAIFHAINQHQQAEDIRMFANKNYKLNL